VLTNGFALFKGEDASSSAKVAVRRVNRYAREMLVSSGGESFESLDTARLNGKNEVVLAFSLESGTWPIVHGYCEMTEGTGQPETRAPKGGEFSLLGKGGDGSFYAARDSLGTRGLWVVHGGPGAGSLASDYRLLRGDDEDVRLLPPGTLYEGGRSRTVAREREEETVGLAFDEAAKKLASLLEDSVEKRVRGQARVAVSFSGGLDSSLLALLASRRTEVVLCSAYTSGSRDEVQTSKAAALLGLKLETAVLEEDATVQRARETDIPPGQHAATMMDRALWCIYSLTSELAAKNKAKMILLGQLADELFGGYKKYALMAHEGGMAAAKRMMRDDVRACANLGFIRDEAACSASCEARFPYADEKIASFATSLPMEFKIRDGERKAILRAAAMELGLPEELAGAPKKAAQFSSGAAKLLRRL
jgi:asparagine synthase (glutamine-hydrolysing)